jgi:hypothetical protein
MLWNSYDIGWPGHDTRPVGWNVPADPSSELGSGAGSGGTWFHRTAEEASVEMTERLVRDAPAAVDDGAVDRVGPLAAAPVSEPVAL